MSRRCAPYLLLALVSSAASLGCAADDCESLVDHGRGSPGRLCGERRVELSLSLSERESVVQGTVNGRPARLLLDTGASPPLTYSARRLGVPDKTWVVADEVCLANMCFQKPLVFAQDSPFSTDAADDINGFVGMAILEHLTLTLDHMQTATLERGPSPCAGARYALTFDASGRPFLDARVDDLALGSVLLDTGAKYTVLDESTANHLQTELALTRVPSPICTVNGCTPDQGSRAHVRTLCVAGSSDAAAGSDGGGPDRGAGGATGGGAPSGKCMSNVQVKYPVWNGIGCSAFLDARIELDFVRQRISFCD